MQLISNVYARQSNPHCSNKWQSVCVCVRVSSLLFLAPSKKKRIIRVNFGIVQTDTMCVQEYGGFATAVRQIQTSREHTHTHLILFSSQCIFYVHA